MATPAYKNTSVDLFEDLKNTNIKREDFKQILSSYNKLEETYINNNEIDLYKDLKKQERVTFSYLPNFTNESIKRVANLHKQLESEVGNLDEIDTFQSPDKKVEFIKVAYNGGKWTITAKNLNDLEFNEKETPKAINCLVGLADRLDEQDAAYALCHAKKAGLFVMAALPYVRTEEFTNTALEPKFVKDPGTVLGPIEHSWDSSVDNTNMPVSRQIASEEDEESIAEYSFDDIDEASQLVDEDGSMLFVSTKDADSAIINNVLYFRDEVDENFANGNWKIVKAASKEDIEQVSQKYLKKVDPILEKIKEQQVNLAAINKVIAEVQQKLEKLQKQKLERLQEIIDKLLPKVLKVLRKIDSLTFNNEECAKKLQVLKLNYEGLVIKYNPQVENYQKRVVGVKEVEEVLAEIRKYVSPRYIKEYERLTEKLFKYTSRLESLSFSLDETDPETSQQIEDLAKELRKANLKKASFNSLYKEKAYKILEDMLVNNNINFDQYSTFTSFADINARKVLAGLNQLNKNHSKELHAGIFDNIAEFAYEIYNSAKDWLFDAISLFSIQEKQIIDINEKLDQIIQEGE